MSSVWRVVVVVVGVAAIVGLILFARGPIQTGPHPAHPIAAIEALG